MNLTWNLDALYTSFNSKKFKDDMEILNQQITNLNEWAEKNLKNSNRVIFKIEEFLTKCAEFRHPL